MKEYRYRKYALAVMLIAAITLVGLVLSRYLYPVPPPSAPPAPAPPPSRGCSDGEEVVLLSILTEQVSNGEGKGFYYENIAAFQTYDGLVITCEFDNHQLEKVWKPGMKMRTRGGDRIIGAYRNEYPKEKDPKK